MKNSLQLTILLLLLFAGLSHDLLAQAPQFLVAATDDPRRVQVSFAQPAMSDVRLQIETQDGQLLHRETLKNVTQFTRAYQLKAAPTGTYTFSLKASSGTVVQTYRLTPEVAPLRMNWSRISPQKSVAASRRLARGGGPGADSQQAGEPPLRSPTDFFSRCRPCVQPRPPQPARNHFLRVF